MIDYRVEDGVAVIAWNMADRPMNVLNADSVAAFTAAAEKALADPAVTGIIVTSAKADFLAGADLDRLAGVSDAAQVYAGMQTYQGLLRKLETGKKPVVAAINGTALGGGYELALACHRRIAADDPKILLGLPEALVGLMPGAGGTQRLPRMIGARAALPLMMESRKLAPQAALKAGLVDQVVPRDQLLPAAKAWLATKPEASQPWDRKGYRVPDGGVQSPVGYQTFMAGTAMLHAKTYGNYPAPLAIMSSVYEGLGIAFDAGLRIEARYFASIATGTVAQSMIRTLFFSMGEANKLGRRPAEVPQTQLTKVGVLGAGMMGAGIAYVSALAGLEVVLIDSTLESAEKGKGYSVKLLSDAVAKGRTTEAEKAAVLDRITPTTDYAPLAGSQLVIEAVFEDRAIKADVTKKAEAVIATDAIYASNTSTLPITGLAEASVRPASFIGLHFFSPVDRMPLVEIIKGKKTNARALAVAMDYVKRIRKTPIVVNDSRGFYTSRVFGTYVQEGLAMLAEGVAPALIENAGRMSGMPVGPLALSDEVSLDLMHKVAKQTRADLGNKFVERPGGPVVNLMVEQLGRIGKKAGKGFYEYPADGKKRLWPGLAEQFKPAAEQPDVAELKRRFLYVQSLEAVRCMDEKVVTDPRDADVGSILGWGFAPFTGGLISLIDGIGAAKFVAECKALARKHGPRFNPPKSLVEMAKNGGRYYATAAQRAAAE
jgi:3-hydroxyacyl-CoA dehydrogenase / enoyl-CoA hydratase / 3-hydroxybutyryl-CoA epimerase